MKNKTSKPNYARWPIKTNVKITNIHLDPENIRLLITPETKLSQGAIIHDLFANEDAMQILDSIVTHEFFPDEPPVVIQEGKRFIVMDGNRRISALKVLARPELLPSKEAYVKGKLKDIGRRPTEVDVVVAPSREAALRLLASKHTQNTRRPWKPLRQAFFYQAELENGKTVKNLIDEYPNINIVKFLKMINIRKIARSTQYDSQEVNIKIHNEMDFPRFSRHI